MSKLTVVLPALNEEKSIGLVVDEIRKYCDAHILVANNGSTDRTGQICSEKGCTVLEMREHGKGGAIRAAFKQIENPYCVILDSDYTYPAKYIPSMLAELVDGADIVVGYRARKSAKAMPFVNSLGNEMLSWWASFLYNQRIYDVCTGMWGFSKSAIDGLNLTSVGFTLEADFFSNARNKGYKLVQIPIDYRARLNGSETKLRLSDGFKIAKFLLRNRIKNR